MQHIKKPQTAMIKPATYLAHNFTIFASFGDETCRSTMQATVQLSRELRSFLQTRHLKICDRFQQFHLVSHDRIEASFPVAREVYVRERITQVARTIQFMDLTGLVPSSREIYGFQTYSKDQRLPGQDHATNWLDPETKALVMLDEPYGYVDHLFPNRGDWAEAHGFCLRRMTWDGTYRPGQGTVCDLVSRAEQGVTIDQIIARLNSAEPRFREASAVW